LAGAASIALFAMGSFENLTRHINAVASAFALVGHSCHPETVTSTEAAHGLTVSSAAEKSASPPQPFATTHGAREFVLVLNLQKPVIMNAAANRACCCFCSKGAPLP
jgi:hypothetical protein